MTTTTTTTTKVATTTTVTITTTTMTTTSTSTTEYDNDHTTTMSWSYDVPMLPHANCAAADASVDAIEAAGAEAPLLWTRRDALNSTRRRRTRASESASRR